MTDGLRARGRRPSAALRRAATTRAGALLAVALLAGCTGPEAVHPPDGDRSTTGAAETGSPASTTTPTTSPTTTPGPDVADGPEEYAAALVAGTNRVRAAEGLPALAPSDCAAEAASARARDLVGSPLEHAPLDGVLAACEPSTRAAENLGRADLPPDDLVEAWMGSPGHRENLLSDQMTQIGVGCVAEGDVMLCSQVFLGP